MNNLYPVFLKLEGKRALVVGGGKVAEQKIKGLLDSGANVVVIAPDVTRLIEALYAEGRISLIRRTYNHDDVDGYSIVIGATDDPEVQRRVFIDARERNIPVNVADEPALCSFYLGAVFGKGDLKVAVSTNGKSPTIGKIIRDRVASEFSTGYPEIVGKMGELRQDIRNSFPDYESRKKVHEQYVRSELERLGLYAEKKSFQDRRTSDGTGAVAAGIDPGARSVGKVYLVGAGPGDPELITVKALRLLRSAEVVLYDALVGEEILSEASSTAELIYVGKRAGMHCKNQSEINELLVEKAGSGKVVVRLKGGDPFVFGRGGEELEALRAAGIDAEVVPGITAGTGVPAALGIPLTHRGESSSVLFITGHEDPHKPGEGVDWEALAHADTTVIYMGARRMDKIANRALGAGLHPSTPVAFIFGGTTQSQYVVTGTLDSICELAENAPANLPGLIVIGETVRSFGGVVPEDVNTNTKAERKLAI